ncbi:hypothetical protein [Streptomyces cavernae]|uniref:hypothetical protein n=1 Tax=Streptomyces cavernae TaxID=2259034 RepID=UPI001EE434C0|nr:hypothetical protein [Streptomyces cavernae]
MIREHNGEPDVALEESPYLFDSGGTQYADGSLHARDRATVDATGAVRVHGRADSLVVIGGLKVDLTEVENVLREHPAVEQAVLVDEGITEAYVAPAAGGAPLRRGTAALVPGAAGRLQAAAGDPAFITTDTVRELLSDRKIFPGVPADLGEDTELVLDSLGLVWLLHVVEERYGLVVEPGDEDIAQLTSLRRLTESLHAAARTDQADGGGRVER